MQEFNTKKEEKVTFVVTQSINQFISAIAWERVAQRLMYKTHDNNN